MTTYKFVTPTVQEGPIGDHRLFYFYTKRVGITVVKKNGVYSTTRYETDSDLSSYQEAYLGGSTHLVSEATKAALIAGNIGVTEANFTAQ